MPTTPFQFSIPVCVVSGTPGTPVPDLPHNQVGTDATQLVAHAHTEPSQTLQYNLYLLLS